ncbi:4a-hydroxytetrahydrobiopterin dehydratase [Quadrisphaera granulorum]|uniref:4a-hydroxytetrahydrobiopterin dehydratase n=1 Tax=Quadrisphaera granulorum TaxID=317664 RepID=UPI0014743260|nr:4a-hydroxytetrahydrobiopterin dehydratase [Quadrisphaera granulorum]
MNRTPLDAAATQAALDALPDWRGRLGALRTAFRAPSAAVALKLVARVGELAEELDHHPSLDWRYDLVFISWTTHSAGWRVTAFDVAAAERTSQIAQALGAVAEPALPRSLELALDTTDPALVRGVWATALGYEQRPGDEDSLYDPHDRGPSVWFQRTSTPAASRWHLDVSVASEIADDVVAAVTAAGASADPAEAPAFTVLTDPCGDRVCICTPLGRQHPAQ